MQPHKFELSQSDMLPHLHFSFDELPEGASWDVGRKYRIELEVEQLEKGKNDATFSIVKVRASEEQPDAPQDKDTMMTSDGMMPKLP